MAKKFFLGTHTVEDVTFLKVSGVVDEDNTLGGSLKRIDGRTVIVDLSEVTRINSCGVRDWVNWLNDLASREKRVIFVRCSPCIVNQINLVNNFVGGGMVKSFFAPYYCARCDREQLELLQVEAFAGQDPQSTHDRLVAPPVRGSNCNEVRCEMGFDDIEEAYFAFLPRNAGQSVDDALGEHLRSLSPTIQDRIKRLDSMESGDETGRTPISGMYSPLTVTTTGVSLAGRDSLNIVPPAAAAEPEQTGSRLTALLTAAALALVGAIIAYVVFVIGGN